MTLAARDERTRLELAHDRIATALGRLDKSLSRPAAVPDDNHDLIESLRGEIDTLRHDNTALRSANEAAQDQVSKTIGRLNRILES
jgi:hypothetical protein